MSTSPAAPPTRSQDEVEIKIVSHSNLFYWWPVWAVGFLMALLTLIDGHRMVVVPANTSVRHGAEEISDSIVLPKGQHFPADSKDEDILKLRTSKSPTYGVIFAVTLLLVIVITNVPLRGMWSVVVIITVVLVSIIFGVAGWWERIFNFISLLDIRINMGGYLFISCVLLGLWLVTFIFFDRQMYIVFTPGQLKVCMEIGGGEKAYDTTGMTVEKKRSDLFRHWILGLGSGDLVVNTAGAHVQHIEMPNVLFIGKKVQMIEDMLREKAVVKGRVS
jgi:hypothetical protein